MDLVSLKTRKLCLHSSKSFKCDHGSTKLMFLLWLLFFVSIFMYLFLSLFFFQGKPEEDTDQMARVSYPDVKCKQFL